jgi:hypothetical protein
LPPVGGYGLILMVPEARVVNHERPKNAAKSVVFALKRLTGMVNAVGK